MPRVQEYLPEQEAQGPVGQTSPMLEQVSDYGRGIQDFGKDVGDAGTIITQRQTQMETSNAYADVAEQRANYMQRIQDERNAGTLDDDGLNKIKQDYQDWTEKQYENYNTAGGKDAFVRASARAQGSIIQTAGRAQAVVSGYKAQENLSKMLISNSNVVQADPSQFDNVRDSQREAVQSQVESGALTPAEADQQNKALDLELSKSAIRGLMQSDFTDIKNSVVASGGKIDPNTNPLNRARLALDGGHFDDLLDSDHKKALDQEIRANQSAAQTAGIMALAQKKEASDAQGEAFKAKSYEQMRNGTFDAGTTFKAFQSGLITSDEQLKLNHLAEAQTAEQSPSNPQAFNSLMARVLSPDNSPGHISDPMQVAYMVKKNAEDLGPGSPNIGIDDFHKITDAINMVPSNRVNSYNEGQLLQQAKNKIGDSDPAAHYKLMQFTNEVQMAKQEAQRTQQPIGPLLDPHSPQYLGNQISKYVASPQQVMSAMADQARGAVAAPANVQTKPGVTPTPAPSVNDIPNMNLNALGKLDPKTLSTPEKAAAAARWRELKRGSK